jgi:uncharacterized membrane protein YfcA
VPELGLESAALLAVAGFLAGAVNAVAGGGSLISFPALLAAGYPPVAANVTNQVAVLPGYVGGSVAYRRELGGQRARLGALSPTTAVGALLGAALLVFLPATAFEWAVPWLVLLACAALAAQPALSRRTSLPERPEAQHRAPRLHVLLFVASVYGGYFGAGLGIMFLAVLAVGLGETLQRLNALKGVLSLLVSVVSAIVFALLAPVAWGAALVMAATTYAGGQVGVVLARRLNATVLRGLVLAFGVLVAVWLLISG